MLRRKPGNGLSVQAPHGILCEPRNAAVGHSGATDSLGRWLLELPPTETPALRVCMPPALRVSGRLRLGYGGKSIMKSAPANKLVPALRPGEIASIILPIVDEVNLIGIKSFADAILHL